MWCIKTIFFLSLCYGMVRHEVLADGFSEFENILKNNGVESSKSNDQTSTVYINGSEYEILDLNKTSPTEKGFHKDTLYKFNVCMNCVFATWTRGELFKLIDIFPITYTLKYDLRKQDTFSMKSYNVLRIFEGIKTRVYNFISILSEFFEKNTYSTYLDTTILGVLLSLNFKIEYVINNFYDSQKQRISGSDSYLIQLVTEVANDIDIFIAANCKLAEKHESGKLLYPYLEPNPSQVDISKFLQDMKPLGLEIPIADQCNMDKILLKNVYDGSLKGFNAINEMRINVGCDHVIIITDVLEMIKSTYDPQLIFWYQEMVMNSILFLVFEKAATYFKSQSVDTDFIKTNQAQFKDLNKNFFSAYHNMPKEIADMLEVLETKITFTDEDKKALAGIDPIIVEKVKLRPMAVMKDSKYPHDTSMRLISLESYEFQNFISILNMHIKLFKHYLQTFRFLSREFNSYYTPFKKDYNKIIDIILDYKKCKWMPVEDPDSTMKPKTTREKKKQIFESNTYPNPETSLIMEILISSNDDISLQTTSVTSVNNSNGNVRDESCNLFTAIIYNCIDTLRYIDRVLTTGSDEDSKTIHDKLYHIKTALKALNERYFCYSLRKITHSVFPYLEVHFAKHTGKLDLKYHQRILSIIAIELNYYGLDYCHRSKDNLIAFQSVREFSDIKLYDDVLEGYFLSQAPTDVDPLSNMNWNILPLNEIYNKYNTNSAVYDLFAKIIKFKWKGEEYKTIREIHDDIVLNVTQPLYYYSFTDIFLKFILSALVIEMDQMQKRSEMKTGQNCNHFDEISTTMKAPKKLGLVAVNRSLFENINLEIGLVYAKVCNDVDNTAELSERRQIIIKQLENFGVSIDSNGQISTTETKSSGSDTTESSNNPRTKVYYELVDSFSFISKIYDVHVPLIF